MLKETLHKSTASQSPHSITLHQPYLCKPAAQIPDADTAYCKLSFICRIPQTAAFTASSAWLTSRNAAQLQRTMGWTSVLIQKTEHISCGAVRKLLGYPFSRGRTLEFNWSRILLGHHRPIQTYLVIRCQSPSWGTECHLTPAASLKYDLHCTKRKIWSLLCTPRLA